MFQGQGRIESDEKIKHHIEEKLTCLPDYMTDWFMNLQASNVTMKSCADYINKVAHFLDYLQNVQSCNITNLNTITERELAAYFVHLRYTVRKDGIKVKTSDSYRSTVWFALNKFFNYLLSVNNITNNYMSSVKQKNHTQNNTTKVMLTSTDFKKIKENIPGYGYTRIRNKAILLLYMTTGMRREALCQIDIDDIDFDTGMLTVVDKGEKEHEYKLTEDTIQAINDWLAWRNLHYITESNALFLSNQNTRISGSSVVNIVKEASHKALGYSISPHKLRAGYCTILYETTHDIEFVRRSVGHADVSTTQRYIKTDDGTVKERATQIFNNIFN